MACNLGVLAATEGRGLNGREHTIGGAVATSGCTGVNPGVGTMGGTVHAHDFEGAVFLHSNDEMSAIRVAI